MYFKCKNLFFRIIKQNLRIRMCVTCIKAVIVLCLLCVIIPIASGCEDGWFGNICKYQCHCGINKCDNSSGECLTGSRCNSEWFGPACQYQDLFSFAVLSTTPANALSTLNDRNDTTCLNGTLEIITINFNTSYTFTWMRVTVNSTDFKRNIAMMINDAQGQTYTCTKTYLIDDATVDIFCDVQISSQQITLKGKGVGYLCSLSISGGRNVALRQSVMQSSNYNPDLVAAKAVDGNRDTDMINGNSCTHTSEYTDPSPNWNITFSNNQLVNRYVIFNRYTNTLRLTKANIKSYDSNGILVFNYTLPDEGLIVFVATSSPQNVLYVKIYAGYKSELILTLCEVEIYGDSVCFSNSFGLECKKSCNCESKTETCYGATGGCPSGCGAGYYGDGCQKKCSQGRWGVDCINQCGIHCINNKCNSTQGTCDLGCEVGYDGDTCANECPNFTWGKNCSNKCSPNCFNNLCNIFNGVCLYGCTDGYLEDNCTEACPYLTWGPKCSNNCSSHCAIETCDKSDGKCDNGCEAGYFGNTCNQNTSSLEYETAYNKGLATGIGIGIGVTIPAVVICIAFYIWFKRRQKPPPKQHETTETNYDRVGPMQTNEHTYHTVDKTGDGCDIVKDVVTFNKKGTSLRTEAGE